jgi:tetratricopeptide (TPR) repeat protein
MHRALLSICVAITATAAPAYAQTGWGMSRGSSDYNRGALQVGPGADLFWDRCTNENHEHSFESATESCTRIIEERDSGRSHRAGALWYRAKLYFDQHQDELAHADLQRALGIYGEMIEANAREPDAYNNRASINMRLEQYDAAMSDYERAIELDNDYPSPHIGRALILFRRGDYAGASAAYDSASRISARQYHTSDSIYGGKCVVRAAARTDFENAQRFCDRAVRNSQASSWALTTRGYLHVMQGNLDAAAADFARAVGRDAHYAPALYGRGAVAVRQGRQAEGEADMTRALEMNRWQVEYYANAGLRP